MTVVVFTDAEPDDMAALVLLCKREMIDYIVVGEGKDLQRKAHRVHLLTDRPVFIGAESDKEFPEFLPEDDKKYTKWTPFVVNTNTTIYMLKPPREFVSTWKSIAPILTTCTLKMYGGFNIRAVEMDMIGFFNTFRETYLFESYPAFGENNSISGDDITELMEIPLVRQTQEAWDKFCMQDAKETCLAIDADFPPSLPKDHEKAAQYNRNRKCYDQIAAGPQILVCDIGLAISKETEYIPGIISFGEYTEFEASEKSSVKYVRACGIRDYVDRMKQFLTSGYAYCY